MRQGSSAPIMMPCVWRQTIVIAYTTLVEAIQQPIALLLQLTAVIMTLLVPFFQFHRFGEDGRLARDSGLSCMLVLGMLLTIGVAIQSVSKEIDRGTAAAVIGKPVSRVTFILAKWLGVLAMTTVFWCGLLATTLLSERCSAHFITLDLFTGYATDTITFFLAFTGIGLALTIAAISHASGQTRFGVVAFYGVTLSQIFVAVISGFYTRLGHLYSLQGTAACSNCSGEQLHGITRLFGYHPDLNFRVIPVAVLLLFALAIFAALTTALATRLQIGTTLAVCAILLFVSLTCNALLAGAPQSSLYMLATSVIPDIQNFWLCDALAHGGYVTWRYVFEVGAYTITCCALCLTVGCWSFQQRDLG